MSEISARDFYSEMQKVRDLVDDKHKSLRNTIESRFDELVLKLDDHAREDQAVADRVLVIETERKKEEQASVKRGAVAGIFAGGIVTTVVEITKHIFK